jgi:DNA recombination protein RmuC
MMDALIGMVLVLVGFVLGGILVWLFRGRELGRLTQTLGEQKRLAEEWRCKAEDQGRNAAAHAATAGRVEDLQAELQSANQGRTTALTELAAVQATASERAAADARQIESLTQLRQEMLKDFQLLAAQALKANEASFLRLANETFEKHKTAAVADVEQRKEAISTLLAPVAETLNRYQQELTAIEKARQEAYGALTGELKNVIQTQNDVRTVTSKLVNALRASPKTRGRWGEETLRNVMELSGMSPHSDFTAQQTFERDEAPLRPDVIVRLPGERFLVVDAKTPLTAYLDAIEAVDDAERELHLGRHAQQTRAHMKSLAAKSYWDGLTVTPDFVVMFIPGENFFTAAIERDAHLFDDAIGSRVLIVTPTTLIALAKAVAFGWRQEKVAENAAAVAELGRDLYKRLAVLGSHVASTGRSIENSVKHYNFLVGSLEGSVMPQARRFNELQVEGTSEPIAELAPVETDIRELRSDRDLIVRSAG